MSYHFELAKTKIHRLDRCSLANIRSRRLSFASKVLSDEKEAAELKLLERREVKSSYIGANLQTSRTPSAIDNHCRNSYEIAKRKLHSSRAKVRFYVTGENNHNAIYAVSPQRFASFDNLLGRLTKAPICKEEKESYTFSLNGSHKITALGELQPGESYVCATYDVFEQLSEERERPMTAANRYKTLQSAALAAARPSHTSQSNRSRRSGVSDTNRDTEFPTEEKLFIEDMKPKLITVLRGGVRPRKSVRILLSKKSTRSFEHTVAGIGEILSPGEQIKRVFGMSGRLVMCLADFYLEDSVFFAYCQDKMNPEDLTLDQTEVRCVGAYRFRKPSAYGRVTLTSHQKGVKNERKKSLPSSALPDIHQTKKESRPGSRAKSCKSSLASISPLPPQKEADVQQIKEDKTPADIDVKSDGNQEYERPSSQTSIKTQSQKSEKSKESIHLEPSRPPSTRPQSQSLAKQQDTSYPTSPVHSPSKKRHLSRNSESPTKEKQTAHTSRTSVRENTEVPKSPEKGQHPTSTSPLHQISESLKGSNEQVPETQAHDPSPASKSSTPRSLRTRPSSVQDKEKHETQAINANKEPEKVDNKSQNGTILSSSENRNEVTVDRRASSSQSHNKENCEKKSEDSKLKNQDNKESEERNSEDDINSLVSQKDKTDSPPEAHSSSTLSKTSSQKISRRSSQSSQASVTKVGDTNQDKVSKSQQEIEPKQAQKQGETNSLSSPRTTSRNSNYSSVSQRSRRSSNESADKKAKDTRKVMVSEEKPLETTDNQREESEVDEDQYSVDFEETAHDSEGDDVFTDAEKAAHDSEGDDVLIDAKKENKNSTET
ncbi:myb-like protein X [Watersipora subatra]|uniref:myb-like protein X n=1 Tax=Watersipora subatra TaxID=2589382 RepID=UPI00355C7CA1